MSLLEEFKNDVAGIELLKDWLGDGGEPIHRGNAEYRGSICVRCPENVSPNWWDTVKSSIADWIKRELELKSQLNLKTTNDDRLFMCRKCGCNLSLKVWAPIDYIKKHVTPDALESSPPFCWMKTSEQEVPN